VINFGDLSKVDKIPFDKFKKIYSEGFSYDDIILSFRKKLEELGRVYIKHQVDSALNIAEHDVQEKMVELLKAMDQCRSMIALLDFVDDNKKRLDGNYTDNINGCRDD